jgi:hypothetical protein
MVPRRRLLAIDGSDRRTCYYITELDPVHCHLLLRFWISAAPRLRSWITLGRPIDHRGESEHAEGAWGIGVNQALLLQNRLVFDLNLCGVAI